MRLRRPLVLLSAGVLAAAVTTAAAAQAQPLDPQNPQTAEAMAANAAQALVASRPAALHASPEDVFQQHQVISSVNGLKYVPYDRTYKGLPVVGGDFVVATNSAGKVVSTSVAQKSEIHLASTAPKLTASQAEKIARGQVSTVDKVSPARLVAYAAGTPALAWQTQVTGRNAEGPSKLDVVVDALTGKVLHTRERVAYGDAQGVWNGPEPLHIDTTNNGDGTYSMTDPNLTNVSCQDADTNTTFTKSSDSWGNGDETNRETGCVDALYGVQQENKMLSQWLGRNSFDGNGGGWPIRVGLNDQNAYYDGSQVQVGDNTAGQWIGAIDVIAHEHGHGIDDHTPGSLSGAGTQEFVADVFGASTEWFAGESAPYAAPDFLVGNQVNLVGSGPIRNMYDPSQLGHKNCYDDTIPNTEVHAAAGPGNHWFYLVAEGTNPTNGQPVSPTCNNSTVTGLGVKSAVQIFYNAMLLKNSNSSYLSYRTWTLTAAKSLFPNSCTEFNTVKAAWDAVSVPAQPGDPTCGSVASTGPRVGAPR
ncbi:M4 family metallopeptidase [Amycolatopsis benzoatilytica]|uniref:M4 family metallopeptidase n=1 Tax=Amycolatopsis benzoatilytica TaxID=346045 RepID=UPI00039F878C|nr:M4 family metallopeptidase [Amycolatopsis benzoatilytica]